MLKNVITASAAFDAAAQPVVTIVAGATCSGSPLATLALDSGRDALKLDAADNTFHAVWHTKGLALASGNRVDYRLCVTEGTTLSGWIDIDVVNSNRDLAGVSATSAGLVLNGPLVIAFGLSGSASAPPPPPPTVGPPAQLVFTLPPGNISAGVAQGVTLEIRDAVGQVVTTATGQVTLALAPNAGPAGATLQGATSATVANGVATFNGLTLTLAGSGYAFAASYTSLSATSSSFTVAAGPAASLSIVRGDGQTANVGAAVAVAPEVLVVDAWGNPVSGQAVTFTVTAGGGSVTGANAVSGIDGHATVGSWTLGPMFGANILTVTSASLSPLVFTAAGAFLPPGM